MSNKSQGRTKYYHLRVFGCQMNKSDGERIEAVMQRAGYSPTNDEKQADVIIAVMCSVRQSAVDRIYGLSGRWVKLKPKTKNQKPKIILTGCVLEFDQKKLAERFDVILPIGELVTSHLSLVTRDDGTTTNYKLSTTCPKSHRRISNNNVTCNYLSVTPKHQSAFQAYVPIMTGCEGFCTYCVVPYVRGKEVSRPVEEIVKEVRSLVKQGYKEITLLGENVNNYSDMKTLKHENIKT